MIIQLNKDLVYSTFNVSQFDDILLNINQMAPSMVEYFLSDLASDSSEQIYINRSDIQSSISLDEYSLYLDYSENIYLEFIEKEDSYETESLW